MTSIAIAVMAIFFFGLGLRALSANAQIDRLAEQDLRTWPVGAARHIYGGANVGVDPAGQLKPFEPGDEFVGVAYEEKDNSSGAAGALTCRVHTQGDFTPTLTGVTNGDVGKAVYATADDAQALSGHPDAFMGRVVGKFAANKAVVRLKSLGEKPTAADTGSIEIVTDFADFFPATGAASGTQYADGFKLESVLGLGVSLLVGEGGGASMAVDAVAEVASAAISTPDSLPVDKGITFDGRFHLTNIADAAAFDFDFGLGTLLTANSKADVDHADMVQLASIHMNGNVAAILAQSDDDTTDVAPVDTTIVNVTTAGAFKDFKIIVRPAGTVEFWIDGARVLASTTFAVLATAALCAFLNIEKTSDDTTAVVKVDRLRAAGGRP